MAGLAVQNHQRTGLQGLEGSALLLLAAREGSCCRPACGRHLPRRRPPPPPPLAALLPAGPGRQGNGRLRQGNGQGNGLFRKGDGRQPAVEEDQQFELSPLEAVARTAVADDDFACQCPVGA